MSCHCLRRYDPGSFWAMLFAGEVFLIAYALPARKRKFRRRPFLIRVVS